MAGTVLEFDLTGIANADARIAALTVMDMADLAFKVGGLVESSTKRRIADEKEAPDGGAWAEWSSAYAETRSPARHSLLEGRGDLRDSIQSYTTGDTVRVGTNLVYGAIHQFGGEAVGKNIPARPYLGLSDRDEKDIGRMIIGELEDLL